MTPEESSGPAQPWRWLLAEAWPRRRALAFVFAAAAAPVLLNLPALWLLKYVFDVAIPQGQAATIVAAVAALTACRLAYGALAYWAAAATARALREVTAGLRMTLMSRLHRVKWERLPAIDGASIQGRLVIDTERVETAANAAFNAAAPALVPLVAFTAVMAWLSWPLALALALIAPVLNLPLWAVSRHVRSETADFQAAFERFNSGAGRLVRMLPVSKAQGTQAHALSGFQSRVTGVAKAGAGMVAAHALYAQANAAVSAVAIAIVLAGGGLAVANGAMTFGSLAAFALAASIAGGAMRRLAGAAPTLMAGREAMTRLAQAIDFAAAEDERAGGRLQPDHAAALALREVSVTLGGRRILRGVSLDVAPGKLTAIAARNGQGKSTIIAVLLGLVPPDEGEATLGGVPLGALDLQAYRAGAGLVPQVPVLIKGTIRENICFGRADPNPAGLDRAVALSGVQDMMARLGATLETQIGEEGRSLSGGEGQRVAIARALAHDPKILFFDEPTNHLDDAAVEALIASVLRPADADAAARPTIFVATHDPRILAAAHIVYDLAFGTVALRRPLPVKASS